MYDLYIAIPNIISLMYGMLTTWNVDLVADLVTKLVPIHNRVSDFSTKFNDMITSYMIVIFNLFKIGLYLKGKNNISTILYCIWITFYVSTFSFYYQK